MIPDRTDFTGTRNAGQIRWQPAEVTSPHLGRAQLGDYAK